MKSCFSVVVNDFKFRLQFIVAYHVSRLTKTWDNVYYFLGLSYRNTAKALQRFVHSRSHVSIWKWIKKYKPKKVSSKRKKSNEFIIDETQIKVGSQYIWLWVAIEPKHRQILQIDLSIFRKNNACSRAFYYYCIFDK